jgi:hypothetical protein
MLAKIGDDGGTGDPAGLDSATDEEIFGLIDNDLGVS